MRKLGKKKKGSWIFFFIFTICLWIVLMLSGALHLKELKGHCVRMPHGEYVRAIQQQQNVVGNVLRQCIIPSTRGVKCQTLFINLFSLWYFTPVRTSELRKSIVLVAVSLRKWYNFFWSALFPVYYYCSLYFCFSNLSAGVFFRK